jgi:hypothetical protein
MICALSMNELFFSVFLQRGAARVKPDMLEARYNKRISELEGQLASLRAGTRPEMVDQETTTDTPEEVWIRNFPQWRTAASLEQEGVISVAGKDYSFVSDRHPIIQVLDIDLRGIPMLDGGWHKINNQVIERAIDRLREMHPSLYAQHPRVLF